MTDKNPTEIIEEIIEICDESIETDHLLEGLKCECGKTIGPRVDLWQSIDRSNTYMIRNTLKSLLKYYDIKDKKK